MNSTRKINWGIVGCGKIAGKFAQDLQKIPNAVLYSVGSRSKEKAQAFAEKYGAKKAFGSYDSLLTDPGIDAVYIATPNSTHYDLAIFALENKVAVLCEKPLALNEKQVQAMVKVAKENNTFLMEALWTLFLPHLVKTKRLINQGVIGELLSIRADFGFVASYDPNSRLYNPALGGGALLDIGIYPLLLAQSFFGPPISIQTNAILSETMVDIELGMVNRYKEGRIAHLNTSLQCNSPVEAYIYGKEGFIHIPSRFHGPVDHIRIHQYSSGSEEKIPFNIETLGYNYEAKAVMENLEDGLIQNPIVTWDFSLNLMRSMDVVRKKIGVVYDAD